MIVSVEGKIYDSRNIPVFVVLSQYEKECVRDMPKDNYVVAAFPSDYKDVDCINKVGHSLKETYKEQCANNWIDK